MLDRISTTETISESAKPFRGRRLSWEQFYALRPDLRADNDDKQDGGGWQKVGERVSES